MNKHLWEIKHDYYCSDSNYYNNDCEQEYKSWWDFISEEGDSELDYNLIFRWDWQEGEDYDLPEFNGDDNYRNAKLKLYFMGQRKGLFRSVTIEVCRADEKQIIVFLQKRWQYIKDLWQPFE